MEIQGNKCYNGSNCEQPGNYCECYDLDLLQIIIQYPNTNAKNGTDNQPSSDMREKLTTIINAAIWVSII